MAALHNILVILGPTASGKSALAFELARQTGAQILSVDSMQVYEGMDIGTAKPTADERRQVQHHLLDVVKPDQSFTVARFVELADEIIRNAAANGIPLIATGGTPLYYQSLFVGLFDGPAANPDIRARLHAMTGEQLHARLSQVDAIAAKRIHSNDAKRLVRALEVYELTGRPISSFQTEWAAAQARHPAVWVGLAWDRELLNRRINSRVRSMIAAGWLNETHRLMQQYASLSKTAAEATGYYELIEHLSGRLTLDDAIEQIKIATRQLARKQMKWFKRFANVTWIDGALPLEDQIAHVRELWRA
jgi:tRNA dimethylallyltransferase